MLSFPTGSDPNGLPVTLQTVLARPHRAFVEAHLITAIGDTVVLGVSQGQVTVDRSAAVRRSCQLTLDDKSGALIPEGPRSQLAPNGAVLRLWQGIEMPGLPTPPKWQLGEFRLSGVPISDSGAVTLQVRAYDYSRTIARNRLTAPWIVSSGTNYGEAIVNLLSNRLPGLKIRTWSVSATTPLIVVDPEEDPWKVATAWATSFGHELYFDAEGYLVIAPEPDPATDPVSWTYTDGLDSHIASLDRELTDEPGYNGVILTSESTTLATPLRAEVWDSDPSSPTYHLGTYGKVPTFVTSPYVATQAQADAAALVEYRRSIGGTEQLGMTVVPNPVLEVGDIIRAVRPASKVDQTTVLESLTLPLGGGAMSLGLRARRTS